MTLPNRLVQAAAEAPCLRERRGDLTDGDCNGHITKHPECALAAAFAALPECEAVDPGRDYPQSCRDGWNDCLEAIAALARFGEGTHEPDNPRGVWCCQEHRDEFGMPT